MFVLSEEFYELFIRSSLPFLKEKAVSLGLSMTDSELIEFFMRKQKSVIEELSAKVDKCLDELYSYGWYFGLENSLDCYIPILNHNKQLNRGFDLFFSHALTSSRIDFTEPMILFGKELANYLLSSNARKVYVTNTGTICLDCTYDNNIRLPEGSDVFI